MAYESAAVHRLLTCHLIYVFSSGPKVTLFSNNASEEKNIVPD